MGNSNWVGCWLIIGLWALLSAVHPAFAVGIVATLIYFGIKAHKWEKAQNVDKLEPPENR